MSNDRVLAIHVSRLEQLENQLSELEGSGWPTAPECRLCLARNEVVLLWARSLLAGLAVRGSHAAQCVTRAGGLCAAHFATCWEASPEGTDRDGLNQVQLDAVRQIADAARIGATGDEFDVARMEVVAARAVVITAP